MCNVEASAILGLDGLAVNTASGRDRELIRYVIGLAEQARRSGAEPFGALLALGAQIVAEGRQLKFEFFDPRYHAELNVLSSYCRAHNRTSLEGYTLYASTEPCPMCAGAIHWVRISRVVFSVSQERLHAITGGSPKPSCASIINSSKRPIEIVGPVLEEEGLAAFNGYAFIRRGGDLSTSCY